MKSIFSYKKVKSHRKAELFIKNVELNTFNIEKI